MGKKALVNKLCDSKDKIYGIFTGDAGLEISNHRHMRFLTSQLQKLKHIGNGGDTLTVLTASKQQHRIRLAEIDAPERSQPFGTTSKQSLSDLCFGKEAEVRPRAIDRYKRTVARVMCAGVDANAEQVNRGMAWVYRRYAKDHDLYVLEHVQKWASAACGVMPPPHHPGNGEKTAMCGRFEQSRTRRYYAAALGAE